MNKNIIDNEKYAKVSLITGILSIFPVLTVLLTPASIALFTISLINADKFKQLASDNSKLKIFALIGKISAIISLILTCILVFVVIFNFDLMSVASASMDIIAQYYS